MVRRALATVTAVAGLVASGGLSVATGFPVQAAPAPAAVATPATTPDDQSSVTPGDFLVVLRGQPLATYHGGIEGYAATAAEPGDRFDARRPAVQDYRSLLLQRQDRVRRSVGNPPQIYAYTTALNGFAARLDSTQVKQLRTRPDVLSVERSSLEKLDTNHSPQALGLTGARGVWAQLGGPSDAGNGAVVGVIDSGVWPENPSFAGNPVDRESLARTLGGFTGTCQAGERWTAGTCNAKLVAAQYFLKGFGVDNIATSEYASPRDGSGHGSHTASTAVGNDGVSVRIEDQDFGHVSGMAPGARLAVYKACWTAPDPADDGCTTADTVKAIDQAVSDGVDVLNYSVGGTRSSYTEAVELAFLNATSGGVFVSTSAGNAGPAPSTVAHPSPWVITVGAASQHQYRGAVRLGDQTSYVGAMVSDDGVPRTRLVDAREAPAAGFDATAAALCEPGSLDASVVEGAVVLCDRGIVARVDKSQEVARAGGRGMLLVNTEAGAVEADFHAVPSVHLDEAAGAAIRDYLARAGSRATAMITPAVSDDLEMPRVAMSSSRGPSAASDGDLLKPDVSAPGASVLAAVSPRAHFGRIWDLYSGTSMSSSHVAGLAALIAAEHPAWSAAAIKSAIVTSARPIAGRTNPFAAGAGQVEPRRFLDPGLVYDAGKPEWMAFLNGQGVTYADGSPVSARTASASDVNLPSIAIGDLVGEQTVTRTVTNVSHQPERYLANVRGLRGLGASVVPDTLFLRPGESADFRVTFSAGQAASYQAFAAGRLVWEGSRGHRVSSPVVVRPLLVDAPEELSASGESGSLTVDATAGVTGTLETATSGLVGAEPVDLALQPGPFDPAAPAESASAAAESFDVPANASVFRVDVAADTPGDDLDTYVYRDGELVAVSATSSGDEQVTIPSPEAGTYDVYVSSAASTSGDSSTGSLTGWVVTPDDAGNLDVGPEPVTVNGGRPFRLTASWSGLDTDRRWFGFVGYTDTSQRTYVTLN